MNTSPTGICNEKEPLSFYQLGLPAKLADGVPNLPSAQWALVVFSGLQKLETHSKHALLSGEP